MQVCVAVNEDRPLLVASVSSTDDDYDADADQSTEVVFAHNNASFKQNGSVLTRLLRTCVNLVKLVSLQAVAATQPF